LFGFLGILVGVAATIMLDVLRAKRERAVQRAADQRELRRAARLISNELDEDLLVLQATIEKPDLWEDAQRSLSMVVWDTWRGPLAALLDEGEAWEAIAGAYRAISDVNWTIIGAKKTGFGIEVHPERNRDAVNTAASRVQEAKKTLSPLLLDRRSDWRGSGGYGWGVGSRR
jgi:hypothetical protein